MDTNIISNDSKLTEEQKKEFAKEAKLRMMGDVRIVNNTEDKEQEESTDKS